MECLSIQTAEDVLLGFAPSISFLSLAISGH